MNRQLLSGRRPSTAGTWHADIHQDNDASHVNCAAKTTCKELKTLAQGVSALNKLILVVLVEGVQEPQAVLPHSRGKALRKNTLTFQASVRTGNRGFHRSTAPVSLPMLAARTGRQVATSVAMRGCILLRLTCPMAGITDVLRASCRTMSAFEFAPDIVLVTSVPATPRTGSIRAFRGKAHFALTPIQCFPDAMVLKLIETGCP